MASTPQFPPATRHITINSPTDTTSSFLPSSTPPPSQPTGPASQLTYIYSSPPSFSIATNTDQTHHTNTPFASFPAAGASCCVVADIGPNPEGEMGKMHKTDTLDYCVVVEGELELTLYGGKGETGEKGGRGEEGGEEGRGCGAEGVYA